MSKQLRLDVAQLTDVGRKRPHNEDNMAYVIPKDPQVMTKKGALFIVADGMGGHAAGEVASEIAVDTVSYAYYQEDSDDIAIALVHAIKRANTLIHQRAAENMLRSGMGTTCVAGVLRGGKAYIANVGDSRSYLVRHGQVRQISQDHSWVAEQVRVGLLTEEQARSHAQRNVITRCLGTQNDVEVDIFAEELEEGDSFVLCSDGLSGFVTDDDLRAIVNQYVPQESVYHLVERANENGGPDNITAIVVHVDEVGIEPPSTSHNGHDIANQPTLVDAQTPEFALPRSNGHVPTGQLTNAATLHPSASDTAPQPTVRIQRRKRSSRLAYPSLVLLILMLVVLVGGGITYLLHIKSPVDYNGSVQKAQALISNGQNNLRTNPSGALRDFSQAQSILIGLQHTALTDAQKSQVQSILNGQFTNDVKGAITSYNLQSLIISLPCSSTRTSIINTNSTNVFANSIATIQSTNGAKSFSYVLGQDNNIYLLDATNTLHSTVPMSNGARVVAITGDNTRLLVLTGVLQQNGSQQNDFTAPFNLAMYTADDSGALKSVNTPLLIDSKFTKDGMPQMLTAWGNDVYVFLTSQSLSSSATILNYTIDPKNKLVAASDKYSSTLSLSPIISFTAFPNHQLFLLSKTGYLQSLIFSGETQMLPAYVSVEQGVAAPLPYTASTFTATTPVSAPSTQSSQISQVLQLAGAKFLSASIIGNTYHLYVLDDTTYHRVLDFNFDAPKSSATPTVTATSATATASSTITIKLNGQYVSPQIVANVKGMVPDPKLPMVYIVAQGEGASTTRTLTSINMAPNETCNA